ncbi:MAG: lasso peptide biosynthesis B2 protein [Candidatus Eremiobacteraeota bacterium]|nr:lasso peptide biosynthesis B2 protein [Candidatus Eremiobacteraeota bacterium]
MVVILDLLANEYVMLDANSSAIWQEVLAKGVCSREQEIFARDCVERGYLTFDPAPTSACPRRLRTRYVPLIAYAWYSLREATRALVKDGFAVSYRRYASLEKPKPPGMREAPRLATAERAFHFAENFFEHPSSPNDCLPRSFALYQLLIYAGLSPEHRIGVRLHPFRADAWVTCLRRPIGDSSGNVEQYTTIAVL